MINNDTDINTNLDIFNSYFHFCLEMIVPNKKVKIYPNNKPWVSKEIKTILNEKRNIMQNGITTQLKQVQKKLKKKISESKRQYKEKVEGLFKTNCVKDAWKGLKTLCGISSKNN